MVRNPKPKVEQHGTINQARVSWDAIPGYSDYLVIKTNVTDTIPIERIVAKNATICDFGDITENVEYLFYVTPFKDGKELPYSILDATLYVANKNITSKTTLDFQGSPCNKKWYDYLTSGTKHSDLECTIEFAGAKKLKNTKAYDVDKTDLIRVFPAALATNVICKKTTKYISKNKLIDDFDIPVHFIVSCTMSDELDPRCMDSKIPSASFSFKVEGLSSLTPLDEVEKILSFFENKMVRIWRGFSSHTGNMNDDNGLPALDYYKDYIHDLLCLGNYKITEKVYNYETQAIDVKCESILMYQFTKDDKYKPHAPAIFWAGEFATQKKDIELIQRYPYPFTSDEDNRLRSPTYFKLGYGQYEMLNSNNSIVFDDNNFFVYRDLIDAPIESYGINTRQFFSGISVAAATERNHLKKSVKNVDKSWHQSVSFLAQDNRLGSSHQAVSVAIDTLYTMIGLENTWKKESPITMLNSYNLLNNIKWIPTRPLVKEHVQDEAKPVSNAIVHDGAWEIVSGLYPSDNEVFLDENKIGNWTRLENGSNGHHFPAMSNTPYKIKPRLLISKTIEKETIDWDEAVWVKTYFITCFPDTTGKSIDKYYLLDQTPFTSEEDIRREGGGVVNPHPSDPYEGYKIKTTSSLKDDVWYSTEGIGLYDKNGVALTDMFGLDDQALNRMGESNYINRGDSIVGYSVLWNTNLAFLQGKQPLSLSIVSFDPTVTIYDKEGNSIDDAATKNSNGLDTIHAYTYYQGLSRRMLNRANNGDVGVKPLFQLTWTMLDDPSLRVGTAVWLPLQNEYVKVYIISQERTFDGGARLKCTGWCYERTGITVLDPTITEPVATHLVVDPDHSPKGDWVVLTWKINDVWDETQSIFYRFYYTPKGKSKIEIENKMLLSHAETRVQYNIPYLSEKLGIKVDATGVEGKFSIKAFYPEQQLSYEAVCATKQEAWDNSKFSFLHAGVTRASNQHQPFISDELLLG